MATTQPTDEQAAPGDASWPQSAAAPSPFTPIADYAFLSDCHTGALLAPDGTVDWLCVPSFDSPSIFGSLLDRQAGGFRVGPFGVNVPAERHYQPGTNARAPRGTVRGGGPEAPDALAVGPHEAPDPAPPPPGPPADEDAGHELVRVVTCTGGTVEIELLCEPVFD